MDPFVLASIIGGGAMLASGGASIAANANLNKKNRQWQEKMAKEQREYDEQIYDKRYSPAAQSQAKAAAGLNPFTGVETMNVGTSSSVPTPATNPYDFGDIGRAGEVIASGLHQREAMKLQRQQFNQAVTNDTRNFIIELSKLDLSKQEINALLKSKEEEIRGMKLDNDTKELNKKMLEDFMNSGGNTFSDSSKLTQAQTNLTEAQAEYQRVISSNADAESKARVKATLAQAYASYASAEANLALAEKYNTEVVNIDQQTWNLLNDEQRKAALHPYDVQLKQIAVEQGFTESHILSLQQQWQDFISRKDSDGDFTLSSVFAKFLLDNVFVSISPGKGKQSSK